MEEPGFSELAIQVSKCLMEVVFVLLCFDDFILQLLADEFLETFNSELKILALEDRGLGDSILSNISLSFLTS